MKNILMLLFFVGYLTAVHSQIPSDIDSLKRALTDAHDITGRIKIYTSLSKKYHSINLYEAKKYATLGLQLSATARTDIYMGDLYRSLGDIAIKEDSMDLGENYYKKAYEYYKTEDEQKDLVMVMNVLGNIQFMRSRYVDAMTWYLDAFEIAKRNDFKIFLAHLYHNIGAVYIDTKSNYDEALKNFSAALDLFEDLGDSANIANVYTSLGETYSLFADTSLAFTYFDKAKDIYIQINNSNGIAQSNIGIAGIMSKNGKYEYSNKLILDAIRLLSFKDKYYTPPPSTQISKCYNDLGANYYLLQDYSSSIDYFKKAYKLGLQNKQISIVSRASEGISQVWESRGNIDSSYHYFRIYKLYSDSLINEENNKKLTMLEAQYKYEQRLNQEKQERQREKIKSRTNYLILALVISGLVMVIAIMILWLKFWRNRMRRAELEQQALKNELETRNKELTTHVMYQLRKNEFILGITKKLRESVYKLRVENRSLVEDIIKDLEHNADDMAWKDFEVRFHRVHVDFNNKLLQKFPDLTANELRLCAFLRLNLNTKEIAAITYQTANSIDTARSRLRQKFGLTKDGNLIGFLMQF
jgi:tetratricopeptide (TPR) repeat protein